MTRRIDALYCTRDDAEQRVNALIDHIQKSAQRASQEVSTAIAERIAALQERQHELISQVERAAKTKEKALTKQLGAIREGTCPPAAAEVGQEQDPNRFLLAADPILTFSLGSNDFLEALPKFGIIGQASTYASLSTAKGPALGVMKTNNPTFLWVTASEREGSRRAEGGDKVLAVISSPQDFNDLLVEDMKDGRYKISFVPLNAGEFSLQVTISDPEAGVEEDIQGSPFNLVVRPPTEYQQIGAEADGKAKIEGLLGHPCGVDFDSSGRFIFVADQSHHQVRVVDSETHEHLHSFGKAGRGFAHFDTPCDLVVDQDNRVLVSDLLNHRIQVIQFWPRSMELSHVTNFGAFGQGEGQFQFPKGVGITESGQLLVCDSGNHRVQMFDLHDNCRFVHAWGTQGAGDGQFISPLAVTTNRTGQILVSDSSNRIQVFDGQGVFIRSFGGKSRKDGGFNYPVALSVNDENALFVCDQGNHRIQVLSAIDGSFMHKWQGQKVAPVAQEEGEDPTSDGEGDASKTVEWSGLRAPAGVAINAHGKVVVTDYQQNVLFAF
jgi:DNA-binding beta-propeller fold protein YncE